MVVRVAPGQVRFVLPHLTVDARGVALGRDVLFRFATLDRLVGFLRFVSAEIGLAELGADTKIRFARSLGGSRESLFVVEQVSPHAIEPLARAARGAQGQGFTGGGRHHVQLRDAQSPLGYDIEALETGAADLHLYAADVYTALKFDGEMSLLQLLLRLELQRVSLAPESLSARRLPSLIYLTVRQGLGPALVELLAHAGVRAYAAMIDSPPRAGAASGGKLWLFRLEQPPPRLAGLFAHTPGITAFFPINDNVAVAAGYRHPLHLDACRGVFEEGRLVLFEPPPQPPRLFATLPRLHPIEDLVRMPNPTAPASSPRVSTFAPIDLRTPLHLVRVPPRAEGPVATLVPWTQVSWVQRVGVGLPQAALANYRIAALTQGLLIVASETLQWFPFGTLLAKAARGVLVPVGYRLRPAVSNGLLEERLGTADGSFVIFAAPEQAPFRVAGGDLAPLETHVLGQLSVLRTPPRVALEAEAAGPAPEVHYGAGFTMPLWGEG